MNHEKKLSLPAAILINLNIMMGGGIFINTVELAKRTGLLSGFMYLLMGMLVFPLILAISHLIHLHPSGGFYVFGKKELSPFIGFISTWSYFMAKLASASLMIHVSLSLITHIFPGLLSIAPLLFYDILVLTLFIMLNLLNMQTGSRIQYGFLLFKLIPLLFVIGLGIAFFYPQQVTSLPILWEGIPGSLPFVLYAATGFEATCALSNKIENGERNGPRAVIISFAIMLGVVFLFQFLFYSMLGTELSSQTNYLGAFPSLLKKIFPAYPGVHSFGKTFFHLAIASSALGGCYGILFSNNWNLYILAHNKTLLGWRTLLRMNRYAIPYICIGIEWLVCLAYLIGTGGNQLILQPLAALGTTITYTASCIALLRASRNHKNDSGKAIAICALISCVLFLTVCIKNLVAIGILPLISFFTLLIIGLGLYTDSNK